MLRTIVPAAALLALAACGGDDTTPLAPPSAPPSASTDAGPPADATTPDARADAPPDAAAPHAGPKPAVSFIDTNDAIHAFLTFDYNVTDVATAATHADYVWGAEDAHVAAYRASANPKIVLSKYIPYTRDPDGTHDLAYWKNLHPDWVLYQCDKTTPAYEFGDTDVPLDISNPAVLDWQVTQWAAPAATAGFDAIAFDNYDLSNAFGACGIYKNGVWTQLYTGNSDPKYTTDVLAWTATMSKRLHALSPKPLGMIPNFQLGSTPASDANVAQVVAAVDGVLDECSFTECASGSPSESTWVNLVAFAELLQAHGKAYFAINEFNHTPAVAADIQWALASYLMGKEHASALFVSGVQQYGSDLWHAEYAAKIGAPCGAMQKAQGMYTRLFATGLSLANPTGASIDFTLPAGSWRDLQGNAVTGAVTMGAGTGLVLADVGAPHC